MLRVEGPPLLGLRVVAGRDDRRIRVRREELARGWRAGELRGTTGELNPETLVEAGVPDRAGASIVRHHCEVVPLQGASHTGVPSMALPLSTSIQRFWSASRLIRWFMSVRISARIGRMVKRIGQRFHREEWHSLREAGADLEYRIFVFRLGRGGRDSRASADVIASAIGNSGMN